MLNVAKIQPVNAFYEVRLGSLSEIYRYPQHPLNMRVTLDVSKTGQVEFSMFDDTGFIVESNLWASGGRAQIKWGYFDQGREIASPLYDIIILKYKVVVGNNYFTINISGTIEGEYLFESKAYSGTLQEVIDQFAEDYGYELEINPPISKQYLRGLDPSGKTTLIKDWEFKKPANVSDGKWITEVIRRYARSDSGVGPYDVIFTQKEDGQKLMRIVLADAVDNKWHWTVQDKESVVVDWQPDIDVAMSAAFGSQELVAQGIAEVTGNLNKVVANKKNIRDFVPRVGGALDETFDSAITIMEDADNVYENSENVPNEVANRGIRVRPTGTINKYLDLNPIYNKVSTEIIAQTIKGTLTILGDPEVASGYRCNIKFLYPSSLRLMAAGYRPAEHYSSGDYYIQKAVHDIKIGSYLTVLEVSRDAIKGAPEGFEL